MATGSEIKIKNESYLKRNEILTSLQKPFSTLRMKNHVMLYLGQYEGKPYVIQSVYGCEDKNRPMLGGAMKK